MPSFFAPAVDANGQPVGCGLPEEPASGVQAVVAVKNCSLRDQSQSWRTEGSYGAMSTSYLDAPTTGFHVISGAEVVEPTGSWSSPGVPGSRRERPPMLGVWSSNALRKVGPTFHIPALPLM